MVVPLIVVELKIEGFGEKLLYKRLEVHPSVQHVLQAAAPRLRKSRQNGSISQWKRLAAKGQLAFKLVHGRFLKIPDVGNIPTMQFGWCGVVSYSVGTGWRKAAEFLDRVAAGRQRDHFEDQQHGVVPVRVLRDEVMGLRLADGPDEHLFRRRLDHHRAGRKTRNSTCGRDSSLVRRMMADERPPARTFFASAPPHPTTSLP